MLLSRRSMISQSKLSVVSGLDLVSKKNLMQHVEERSRESEAFCQSRHSGNSIIFDGFGTHVDNSTSNFTKTNMAFGKVEHFFFVGVTKSRLDFQPFCAPAFLRAHHGWITGLPYCIFDQSETCLHESCRQVSDWSIQSRQQQRWRLSLKKNFLLPTKSVSELFKIGKFEKCIKKH